MEIYEIIMNFMMFFMLMVAIGNGFSQFGGSARSFRKFGQAVDHRLANAVVGAQL